MAEEDEKKGATPSKKDEVAKKGEPKVHTPAAKPAPKSTDRKPEGAKADKESKTAKKDEKPTKKTEKGGDEKEDEEKDEDEDFIRKPKPDLSHDELRLMKVRKAAGMKRPHFIRQEASTHYRLARGGWRKPKGGQSRRRQHESHRVNIPSIGFRGPAGVRDLHPSGFEDVLVSHAAQLKGLDPKRQAVRISAGVSRRRRPDLEEAAEDAGLWVLNPKMEYYVVKIKDPFQIVELGLTAKGDKRRPGGDAILIDPSVPERVREDIIAEAEDRGIRVLNPGAGKS